MSPRTKMLLKSLGIPVAVAFCFGLLAVYAAPAFAQADLTEGITTATSSFKGIIKTVFTIASIVIVVGGLVVAAWKFTQRDPHALHYLVGTIAAGALCGIVSGIL